MLINSMLQTDLYKFTMQQAVLFGRMAGIAYQDVDVEYEFINRGKTQFSAKFADKLRDIVLEMSSLQLGDREFRWLQTIPFLKRAYLEWLRGYRFDPAEVNVSQKGGQLSVRIAGPWYRTILWEVPLLAAISELYYKVENCQPKDVIRSAQIKGRKIRDNNLTVADFGTRRRFSNDVHETTVGTLIAEAPGCFMGTSNLYLAHKFGIKPIGTHAHEWFQAHAALFGYKLANRFGLEAWAQEFGGNLGIALPDTFTSDVFFKQFDMRMSKLFDGVRHDSSDPIEFAEKVIDHYKQFNIDPLSKTIVFSDGLTIDKAIEINRWCMGKIKCSFGIGTHLTNDCGHTPLNIVIKMIKCNGTDTVKLSDVAGKHTGAKSAQDYCKYALGI